MENMDANAIHKAHGIVGVREALDAANENDFPALPDGNVTDSPQFSDDALALKFVLEHKDSLRYVAARKKWIKWSGKCWADENTLAVFDLVKRTCRGAAEEAKRQGEDAKATSLCSAKTVVAVEKLARSDRAIAATLDQWDFDRWLLNTPDGVVDLKTGKVRPHRPGDYMTKITAAAPKGRAPKFEAFLRRITDGDEDMQSYLARVFGYAATGIVTEHAMFFWYGTGANGKSVLLNTISKVLGDYAQTAPIEAFTASKSDRHPTELADLPGARLVTAVETEEGRHWAEAKIKALTGGDNVKTRKMRRDFFEFSPQFKLVIAGNHQPGLQSVDEAIKRRFNLIPSP